MKKADLEFHSRDYLTKLMSLIPDEDLPKAQNLLKNIDSSNIHSLKSEYFNSTHQSVNVIASVAAKIWGCTVKEMKSKCRRHNVINARSLVYQYLVKECGFTFELAGTMFGQDHSTVLHSVGRLSKELKIGGRVKIRYNDFTTTIRAKKGVLELEYANK